MFTLRRGLIRLGKEVFTRSLCVALLLSLPACLSHAAESIPEPLPRISFEEKDHDFGNAVAGTILRHSFRFRNIGEKPLFIENVKAG